MRAINSQAVTAKSHKHTSIEYMIASFITYTPRQSQGTPPACWLPAHLQPNAPHASGGLLDRLPARPAPCPAPRPPWRSGCRTLSTLSGESGCCLDAQQRSARAAAGWWLLGRATAFTQHAQLEAGCCLGALEDNDTVEGVSCTFTMSSCLPADTDSMPGSAAAILRNSACTAAAWIARGQCMGCALHARNREALHGGISKLAVGRCCRPWYN